MNTIPMSNVRAFYAGTNPDGHWFDAGTMRFFKTRLPKVAYQGVINAYFITSEVNPSGQKRYTIRKQDRHTGDIATFGEFHSFVTRQDALRVIKSMLAARKSTI